MKILKILLFVVLLLVVAVIILGFAGPKEYDVSSTANIDAPVAFVYPYLLSLEKGNAWGPWKTQDPDMTVSYEGQDGTIGAASSWDGPIVGKGTQTIKAFNEGQSVQSDIIFDTPFGEMASEGYMEISPDEEGSQVTWGFKGQLNFIGRVMGVFSDMESNTKPMFDQGLSNLDSLVRHDMTKAYNGQHIQYIALDPRSFIAKRAVVSFDGMQGFYMQHLPRLAAAAARAGVQMDGMPCGLYYSWDEEQGSTDMAAAIPVPEAVTGRDMEMVTIEGGRGLLVEYHGDYDGLGAAHGAIDEYMTNFNLNSRTPAVEEYITDPSVEPDTSKWLTRIYYYLQEN